MKRHDVEQGSEEWRTLRLGIPTASMFHRIISPARLEPSAQRHRYLAELLVELQTGRPYDMAATSWMGRGTRLEEEARKFYEKDNDRPPPGSCFVESSRRRMADHPQEFSRQRLLDLRAKLPNLSLMRTRARQDARPAKRRWWQRR